MDGWALNVLCCLRYQSCYGSTVPTRKTWHFVQTRHMRASSCREAAAGRPAGYCSMSAHQCFCALQRCGTSSPHPPPHAGSSWGAWVQQIVREVCVVAGLEVYFYRTQNVWLRGTSSRGRRTHPEWLAVGPELRGRALIGPHALVQATNEFRRR